jgi:transposase-like protein
LSHATRCAIVFGVRCIAKTRSGGRCKRRTRGRERRCAIHLGGRVGLPAALSDELANAIVESLERGATITAAASAVGISRRTLTRWLTRGLPGGSAAADEPFRVLRQRVMDVRVERERAKDWRAAAWWLERRFPERWSPDRDPLPEEDWIRDERGNAVSFGTRD